MNDVENAGAPPAPKRKTIGAVAGDAIREGLTNEQALERVLEEFPYARTTKATIGKYRRTIRNQGEDVPTEAQARFEAGRGPTAGSVAMDAIRAGKTTRQVVEIVKARFPKSRISESSVNSYRSRLRGRGEEIPTAREASAAAEAGVDLLVANLEEARAARAAMATKADLAALETRLVRRVAGLIGAAVVATVVAVNLLS